MLPDTAHLVTLRSKSTEPGFGISSLPLPNITQRGSKSHLHLPSSHAGFHAHWRHWATARLKLILKHGFLLQLHWKKTLNLQGRTSPRTFLFCFSCCCYIFFFFFFFPSLLFLLIFEGLKQCILILLIPMWRMWSLSQRFSLGQVLYGYQSSATCSFVHMHTSSQLHHR